MVNGCAEDMQTTLRDTQEANPLAEAAVGALRESEASRSHDFEEILRDLETAKGEYAAAVRDQSRTVARIEDGACVFGVQGVG